MIRGDVRGLRRLSAALALMFILATFAVGLPAARPASGAQPQPIQGASLANASRITFLPLVARPLDPVIPPQIFNSELFLRPVPLQQVQRGAILSVEYRYTNGGPGVVANDTIRIAYPPQLVLFDSVSAAPGDGYLVHDSQAVVVAVRNVRAGETRTGRVNFYVRFNAGVGQRIRLVASFTCGAGLRCNSNTAEVEVVRNESELPSGGTFTMSVTPDRGEAGTAHTFQGFGFIPGEEFRTWLNTPDGVAPLTISGRADANGRIWFTFGTWGLRSGFYSMVAHGVSSGVENVGPFIVQLNGSPGSLETFAAPAPGGLSLAPAAPVYAEPAQVERGSGGIGGRVLDAAGAGVAGVVVEVHNSENTLVEVARSGPGGSWFVASGLVSGAYTVTARPGVTNDPALIYFGRATVANVAVVEPNLTSGVDIKLPAAGGLRGSFPDALAGVRVQAVLNVNGTDTVVGGALSDATGVYTLTNLAAGSGYTLRYDPSAARGGGALGFAEIPNLTVTAGQISEVTNVAAKKKVVKEKGALSGRVSGPGGTPVADVIVVITQLSDAATGTQLVRVTRTDASGVYHSEGLPLGEYRVQFLTLFSRNPATSLLSGSSVAPVVVAAGTTTVQDVQLVAGATVSGVVRGDNAAGLAGVFVLARDANADRSVRATTRSAEDGSYTLSGLTAGAYTLEFLTSRALSETVQAYAGGQQPVTVVAGATVTGINITLSQGSRISGLVQSDTNTPLEGVRVVFVAEPEGGTASIVGATQTAADGRYRSPGLAPGRYKVFFTSFLSPNADTRQYQSRFYNNAATLGTAQAIVIGNERTTLTADATLALGGTISGRVSAAASGENLAGVFVIARDANGIVGGAVTDVEGRYNLTGLPPGEVTLSFNPDFAPSAVTRSYTGVTSPLLPVVVGASLTRDEALNQDAP
jgi:hypothetical protein